MRLVHATGMTWHTMYAISLSNNFCLNITIDQCKFAPKRWFNDLTNVTFHKSANIIIAIHMDHLHTTQQLHIYLFWCSLNSPWGEIIHLIRSLAYCVANLSYWSSLNEGFRYNCIKTNKYVIVVLFGALKSDSTHHFFRNACIKSGSLRFSQFSGCWLILSVYIIMSFDFPFVRLFGLWWSIWCWCWP
jgi:hypothetical protein